MKWFILGGTFAAIVLQSRFIWASADSIGPNGINSSVLALTGMGIDIGQVELRRPGDPNVGKDESQNLTNSTVDPEQVFYRQSNTNFDPNYNLVNETSDHAERVAGIMISTDAFAQGVAQEADLFSIGVNPQSSVPLESTYEHTAVSINHLATLPSQRICVINLSLAANSDGDADGTSTLTSYIDWSARTHDILYVAANSETNAEVAVIPDNFNGITVVASTRNGTKYREVDPINVFTLDDFGTRTFPDIMAPGRDILMTSRNNVESFPPGLEGVGTSFAAPHVTGTAALLHQHAVAQGWGDNARRHEVMKAVIMNSADKIEEGSITEHNGLEIPQGGLLGMERTAFKQQQPGTPPPPLETWFNSGANDDDANAPGAGRVPLDDQMGVGHLNANRAFTQFSAGEFNESTTVDVPVIGWDYGTTTGVDDINRYRFNEPLKSGSFVSITLAFDRIVTFENDADSDGQYDVGDTFVDYKDTDFPGDLPADSQINDLDLYFLPRGSFNEGQALAQSISLDSTVDHIFFQVPTDGEYEFWVQQHDADVGTSQNYGVAWWALGSSLVNQGDFNNDGQINEADLGQWKGDFGPTNDGSDADGDGDSDGADFLTWQRNVELGMAVPAIEAVPEPNAWLLSAFGLAFLVRRRAAYPAAAIAAACGLTGVSRGSDTKLISLSDMFTTSGQEEIQRVDDTLRIAGDKKKSKIANQYVEQVYERSSLSQSNLFVVGAANLHDAIGASAKVIGGLNAANEFHPVSDARWLVVYLGCAHSDPLRWVVDGAAIKGNRIRFNYRELHYDISVSNVNMYYYWVPLGKIDPGTYEIELYDADEKAVTLMRRVKVESKPK